MLEIMAKVALAALLVAGIPEAASGCAGTSTRNSLEFETLDYGGVHFDGASPAIYVLTDSESTLPTWYGNGPSFIDSVDFSTDFAVSVGVNSHDAMLITDVWQVETTVYVRAQFIVVIPGMARTEQGSPDHTIRVSKERMRRFGEITFKLLDGKRQRL